MPKFLRGRSRRRRTRAYRRRRGKGALRKARYDYVSKSNRVGSSNYGVRNGTNSAFLRRRFEIHGSNVSSNPAALTNVYFAVKLSDVGSLVITPYLGLYQHFRITRVVVRFDALSQTTLVNTGSVPAVQPEPSIVLDRNGIGSVGATVQSQIINQPAEKPISLWGTTYYSFRPNTIGVDATTTTGTIDALNIQFGQWYSTTDYANVAYLGYRVFIPAYTAGAYQSWRHQITLHVEFKGMDYVS